MSFHKSSKLSKSKSLNEAGVAKRKQAKPSSIWDIVEYSQGPIESINMGEKNIFRANSYGAIDAVKKAIKDRFDQEDLKKL